jgi:spore coat polysaccharide biosynthesis predicted glycosyltransferase SpsG
MNIGICCKASHVFGMGHLYRMLTLAQMLRDQGANVIFVVNADAAVAKVLTGYNAPFIQQDFSAATGWEAQIIGEHKITIWINDRLQTQREHAQCVTGSGVKLVTFDDVGDGAVLADLNIVALPALYEQYPLQGKAIRQGVSWLILPPVLEHLRRHRSQMAARAVCLGGSDTYGVTVRVAEMLRQQGIDATYFVGPAFRHGEALAKIVPSGHIRQAVPSLLEELARFDLAITGGGMIAFESAAMGLPTIVIANEKHEEFNARMLERLGCSFYAGYHEVLESEALWRIVDIAAMSRAGLDTVATDGGRRVVAEIEQL